MKSLIGSFFIREDQRYLDIAAILASATVGFIARDWGQSEVHVSFRMVRSGGVKQAGKTVFKSGPAYIQRMLATTKCKMEQERITAPRGQCHTGPDRYPSSLELLALASGCRSTYLNISQAATIPKNSFHIDLRGVGMGDRSKRTVVRLTHSLGTFSLGGLMRPWP